MKTDTPNSALSLRQIVASLRAEGYVLAAETEVELRRQAAEALLDKMAREAEAKAGRAA